LLSIRSLGGGSIPLEALRLGCDAFASDLNPVACLILKVVLEDIPRYGADHAEELRKVGAEIKQQAANELAEYYPPDPDGATPIAYLWARTVRCESPNCGAEIPLVRSFWLCKKANRLRALRHEVKRPKGKPPYVEFEVFAPENEKDVPAGTVSRAKATCLACGRVLAPERVRAQLREHHGGADTIFDASANRVGGARLLALVTLNGDKVGRQYRVASDRDYQAVWSAQKAVAKLAKEKLPNGISVIPDEPLPPHNTNCFRVPNYGVRTWLQIFNTRQALSAAVLARLIGAYGCDIATKRLLALCLGKSADLGNAHVRWKLDAECPVNLFARQAISMVWDFAEAAPTAEASGSFDSSLERSVHTLLTCFPHRSPVGQVSVQDARWPAVPDEAASVWFTDPPYYDAIGYAELSDFFFVWLKRIFPNDELLRDPFNTSNPLTRPFQSIEPAYTKDARARPGHFLH
jgi:adenine-specific DNA methylase